jgi:hypothetical protein
MDRDERKQITKRRNASSESNQRVQRTRSSKKLKHYQEIRTEVNNARNREKWIPYIGRIPDERIPKQIMQHQPNRYTSTSPFYINDGRKCEAGTGSA